MNLRPCWIVFLLFSWNLGAENTVPIPVTRIFAIAPLGAAPGTTTDVEIFGEHLAGAERIAFDEEDLKGEILERRHHVLRARIVAGAKARCGVHTLRVFTNWGPTNLIGFRLQALRHLAEREPNQSAAEAQAISWPAVVNGSVGVDEDVDFYRFAARAGAMLRIAVLTSSVGSGLRPQLYLLDSLGHRLATGFESQSELRLEYAAQQDSEYLLVVRGASFALTPEFPTGHPAFQYQLQIIARTVLTRVEPSCWTPGGNVLATLRGEGLEAIQAVELDGTSRGAEILERNAQHLKIRIMADSDLKGPVLLRAISPQGALGPVHASIERCAGERIDTLDPPFVVEGHIGEAGTAAIYRFRGAAGKRYRAEIEAARFDSSLDSILSVHDEKGTTLFENDDGEFGDGVSQGDSALEFSLPASGIYEMRVRQSILNLAGADYVFRLRVRESTGAFAVRPTPDSGLPLEGALEPDRLLLAPNGTAEIPVTVMWLEGFEKSGASICLRIQGLPESIDVQPACVEAKDGKFRDEKKGTGLFSAKTSLTLKASGAKPGVYPIQVRAEAVLGGKPTSVTETVPLKVNGRYVLSSLAGFPIVLNHRYLTIVEAPALALRPEIGYELYPFQVTLQAGKTKILPVTVLRSAGFSDDLEFRECALPRGINLEKVEPELERNRYLLHLRAAPDAEKGWFPFTWVSAVRRGSNSQLYSRNFAMEVR